MQASTFVRALLLSLPLYAGSLVILPSAIPVAEAKAKKAHKAKKAKKAIEEVSANVSGLPDGDAKPAKVTKVTAKSIVKWSKRGDTDSEIVAKAEAAGYTVTKKDARLFKIKKLSPALISKLGGEAEADGPVVVAMKEKEKVDLTKPAKVKDIDFDDVPPPEGSAEAATAKKKAPVAAPVEEPAEKTAAAPQDNAPIRKPIRPAD